MNAWGALLAGSIAYGFWTIQSQKTTDEELVEMVHPSVKQIAELATEYRKHGIPIFASRFGDNEYMPQLPSQGNANQIAITTGDPCVDAAKMEVARNLYFNKLNNLPQIRPYYAPSITSQPPIIITTLGDPALFYDPSYIYQFNVGVKQKLGRTHEKY
jgi:hypothetical protein